MNRFARVAFVLFASTTAIFAHGQESLSLQQAVEIALKKSPVIRAFEQRVGIYTGYREQAGKWVNPRFIFQTENLGGPQFDFGNDADVFAFVSQPFELPGKRSSRIAIAQANLRRAELQRSLARRETIFKVKTAYWKALATQRSQQLLRENVEGMESLVVYHQARVSEGAMPEADLLRVQLERERYEIEATNTSFEAQRALIDLFREMGEIDIRPVRLSDELESISVPLSEITLETALANRQEVLQAKAVLQHALANQSLQRAIGRPDLDITGGYKRTGGQNTGLAGFSLNLPIFDRNQGNVKASAAEVSEAEALVAASEAAVRAEFQAATAEYVARQKQVSTTLKLIRSHATETARIAHAAYREGGIDLLRLIDSERIRIESELLYYRALSEFQQSVANLENVSGVSQ